jgi:hypothetical protein
MDRYSQKRGNQGGESEGNGGAIGKGVEESEEYLREDAEYWILDSYI